jgi:hypothetical protein
VKDYFLAGKKKARKKIDGEAIITTRATATRNWISEERKFGTGMKEM